tara:strand:- start:188 stop:457 length:270 start_codon:yes stop_codon:yes gene_type:complete
MSDLQDTLDSILKKMDNLERIVRRMEERLIQMEKVIPACERMDDHVTFVNGVYTTVKAPIEYICSAFSRTDTKLPNVSENMYLQDEIEN